MIVYAVFFEKHHGLGIIDTEEVVLWSMKCHYPLQGRAWGGLAYA